MEDHRALKIMDQSATLVNGHCQLKLPFCENPPNLPDSLAVAEKRLKWLKVTFHRNPVFHSQYGSVLEKYQKEGSSRQVLIMQYVTHENQKNQEWCLTVLSRAMEHH